MFLVGLSDRWSWEEDAFSPVAFCVRALVQDGLRVPPFDRHADGDGGLRALGLDASVWLEWLTAVLRQWQTLAEVARALAADGDREQLHATAMSAGEVLRVPGSFCPGSDELLDRLNELWVAWAPSGEAWRSRMSDIGSRIGSGRQQRALWKALLPYHDRLATLSVFLVDYPEPVVMPLPPTSCLIAPVDGPEAYGRQVIAAASGLVTAG